jgi:hypothetical protein
MMGLRKWRLFATAAMLGLLALVVAGGASAAKPAAGLDASYGQGGVASAQLPGPPNPSGSSLLATAPDGSAYLLTTRGECPVGCASGFELNRWTPDGALDTTFGSGGAVQLPGDFYFPSEDGKTYSGTALTVDARGRPLVGRIESDAFVVRRFLATGQLDTSFGSGGTVSIPCYECERTEVWLLSTPEGGVMAEQEALLPPKPGAFESSLGGQVSFTSLSPVGKVVRSFGHDGRTTIRLGQRAYPGQATMTPKGGILLGDVGCCGGIGPYLIRVSAKGRIDTKFGRSAGRSLARLSKRGETASLVAVLPRANGKIDLVGDDRLEYGFDLRLKADGGRAKFGKGGLEALPFEPLAAARGSEGAIVTTSAESAGYTVQRVLADGRIDPAFGPLGLRVPLSGEGLSLGTPAKGKFLVYDAGRQLCRESCSRTPGFARFNEGNGKG